MQRRNDSQRAALEELIELRLRHIIQQQHEQQQQLQLADRNTAVAPPIVSGSVNPPRLGPYPYDRELSAAAAAFNETVSSQTYPSIDHQVLPTVPSQGMATTSGLRPDLRQLFQDGSSRIQLQEQQERDRIFRIARGLPPRDALEDDRLQRLDFALPLNGLRNLALGQNTDPGLLRARPHFALTTPSSPMAAPFDKQNRSLSLASQQEPRKSTKRASETVGDAVQSKPRKRMRSSPVKSTKAPTILNQVRLERHSDNSRSKFPLPALHDSQIRKIKASLTSCRRLWNGVKTEGMRKEVFLRRLRWGMFPVARKSSSTRGTTTVTARNDNRVMF